MGTAGRAHDRQRSQTAASTSSLLCDCVSRSFQTVTVEHPTERSQTAASTSSLLCDCVSRSFQTVTVEHPTERSQTVASTSSLLCDCVSRSFQTVTVERTMLYDQQLCVNNHFGRFSAIFIGIFLVISACSLDILETLRISEIDSEKLRNQQHLFYNHNER